MCLIFILQLKSLPVYNGYYRSNKAGLRPDAAVHVLLIPSAAAAMRGARIQSLAYMWNVQYPVRPLQ